MCEGDWVGLNISLLKSCKRRDTIYKQVHKTLKQKRMFDMKHDLN